MPVSRQMYVQSPRVDVWPFQILNQVSVSTLIHANARLLTNTLVNALNNTSKPTYCNLAGVIAVMASALTAT